MELNHHTDGFITHTSHSIEERSWPKLEVEELWEFDNSRTHSFRWNHPKEVYAVEKDSRKHQHIQHRPRKRSVRQEETKQEQPEK